MTIDEDASSLTEMHGALALFAEAIAGQPRAFEIVDDPSHCWPWSPSDFEARSIRVPARVDDVRLIPTRNTYRAITLHQLVATAASRDSAVSKDSTDLQSGIDRSLFRFVLAQLEDLRSDAITRHRYPGAVTDLEHVLHQALDVQRVRAQNPSHQISALDIVRWRCLGASSSMLRSQFGQVDEQTLELILSECEGIDHHHASFAESRTSAIRICRALAGTSGGAARTSDDLADEPQAEDTVGTEATGASLDSSGTPAEVEPADGVAGGQPGTETVEQLADASSEPREWVAGLTLALHTGKSLDGAGRTFVYDEWDYRAQAHRRAWCRVVEEQLVGTDFDFLADVRFRHRSLRSRIRRSFVRLRPQELVRVHRSLDGEELDLDAAIEAVVDHRTGAPADDRLHVRRDRAARDVATALLVDLSASTSSPAVQPEPEPPVPYDPDEDPLSYGPIWGPPPDFEPVRRVIDVARDSVALMSDALHELGDQHAIYGFSGTGRDNVDFVIAKDFEDRASANSWAAIAEMKPLRYTRMGPAIRHASAKLAAQPNRTKLLIVVSDGYPQDIDYGDDRRDRDYGIHDTARALSDATDLGIDTFCVTIDPAGHDYLRDMCPDHRYLVIDDVESLPEELAKLYVALSE